MKWPTVNIDTSAGNQPAIAPLIISASRATDIPAFYSEWFMERLRAGYCLWINPFNRRNTQYISFAKTKMIVFWSKNPAPLLPYLPEIQARGYNFYFQFTLNDYEQERLEPNLPSVAARIDTFKKISRLVGKERIIWRFDPIILSDTLSIANIAERIFKIGAEINNYTAKLVFSFVDIDNYKKVRPRLAEFSARELKESDVQEFCVRINALKQRWANNLELATCAEQANLDIYDLNHNKCIDDELICRLCQDDPAILDFFGPGQAQASLFPGPPKAKLFPKDKGQRRECCCVPSKDIGAYNTCSHLCVYCYANHGASLVRANAQAHTQTSESLLPCRG